MFFNYTTGFSVHNTILFYRRSRFQCKISVFLYKNGFLNYTTGFSIQSTIFFYRKPRFRCKISVFPCKTCVFLTIQPYFRYKVLFSSIENLVFDVKFQSFLVKTVSDFRYIILFSSIENLVCNVKLLSFFIKTVFLNYTTRFSLQSTIFLYRKPRFRCKVSVFPCKNCVFLTIYKRIFGT